MKFLALLVLLAGCATTSEIELLQKQIDENKLRTEIVRLEAQIEGCDLNVFACMVILQDKQVCIGSGRECKERAIQTYKKLTGKATLPQDIQQYLEDMDEAFKQDK